MKVIAMQKKKCIVCKKEYIRGYNRTAEAWSKSKCCSKHCLQIAINKKMIVKKSRNIQIHKASKVINKDIIYDAYLICLNAGKILNRQLELSEQGSKEHHKLSNDKIRLEKVLLYLLEIS